MTVAARRIRLRAVLRLGLALVAAGAAVGCDGVHVGSPCESNAECGSRGVCNLPRRRCAFLDRNLYGAELLPPTRKGRRWTPREILRPPAGPGGWLTLALARPVMVHGQVRASGGVRSVPARVTAWQPSPLAGRPSLRHTATTSGASAAYELWVGRGSGYGFTVTPETPQDTTYPPLSVSGVSLPADTRRDFVLEGPDRSILVKGRILDAALRPLPFSVQVHAFSSDQRWRSSVGRTCATGDARYRAYCACGSAEACAGEFAIRLPSGSRGYTLRIAPLPEAETAPSKTGARSGSPPVPPLLPTVNCVAPALGLPATDGGQTLRQPIRLPSFRFAQRYTVAVVGDYDKGLAGAQVQFTARLPMTGPAGLGSCTATFSRTGITDAQGRAVLLLLPGDARATRDYEVVVTPPQGSRYASRRLPRYAVGPSGGVLSPIRLSAALVVGGTVRDPDGRPVSGASVEARPLLVGSSREAPPARTARAVTGRGGTFSLHVDPGRYDLLVIPPASRGLQALALANQDLRRARRLAVALPDARLAAGVVIDGEAKPVAGVTVRLFGLLSAGGAPRAVVLGTTQSDARGRFVLPSPAVR